jgi:hypothetical protein
MAKDVTENYHSQTHRPLEHSSQHSHSNVRVSDERFCTDNTVQFPYLDTRKVFKECGQSGVSMRLVNVCDSANTICAKTFITLQATELFQVL